MIRILLIALLIPTGLAFCNVHAVAQEDGQKGGGLEVYATSDGKVPLQGLVQWLAQQMSLTITADSSTLPDTAKSNIRFFGKKPVNFSTDNSVAIVQSILRSNGLALVKSEVSNVYQIVRLADVRPFAPVVDKFGTSAATYATGVFQVDNISTNEAKTYIEKFLYKADDAAKVNITLVPNQKLLVITETDDRLQRIKKLLESIDIPKEAVFRDFYELKNLQAAELKQQLDEIFGLAVTADPGQPASTSSQLKISAITSTNQLLISGTKTEVESVVEIAMKIDVELNLQLKTHRFSEVSARRIDELVRQGFRGMDESQIERVYQANVNEQANELVANTQPQIHARIEALKEQLDVAGQDDTERSPVRFYTLKNVKAIDIVDTLQSIEQRVVSSRLDRQSRLGRQQPLSNQGIVTVGGFVNDGFFGGGSANGGFGNLQSGIGLGSGSTNGFVPNGTGFNQGIVADDASQTGNQNNGPGRSATGVSTGPTPVIPGQARITVDENTNTLIIVAEPATQKLYATLIERLDVRRPQVLIEVNIVTLSQQDDATLGVEISGGRRDDSPNIFGVNLGPGGGAISDGSGIFSVSPTVGFTGALLDPQTADVVLRALARHQTARVTSTPRILVNDNALGTLSSTEEIPFQATNSNANTTVTSVGGFLQAGTTINVTPQISEDDYLNLEFDILVNDFVGTSSAEGLPPGRSTNQVTSSVSIPDGHTIVVGGLTRKSIADDLTGLPIIERIPILSKLTSTEVDSEDESKLFVFIKPIILRDDKFQDLRFLSEEDRREALLPDDLPSSGPVLIR